MKRLIAPLCAPAFDPPFPARPMTYNEECAATGGRSYNLAPRVQPKTAPEPDAEESPPKTRRARA